MKMGCEVEPLNGKYCYRPFRFKFWNGPANRVRTL